MLIFNIIYYIITLFYNYKKFLYYKPNIHYKNLNKLEKKYLYLTSTFHLIHYKLNTKHWLYQYFLENRFKNTLNRVSKNILIIIMSLKSYFLDFVTSKSWFNRYSKCKIYRKSRNKKCIVYNKIMIAKYIIKF